MFVIIIRRLNDTKLITTKSFVVYFKPKLFKQVSVNTHEIKLVFENSNPQID